MNELEPKLYLTELRAKDIQQKNLDLKFSLLDAMKHKNLLSFKADTIKIVEIQKARGGGNREGLNCGLEWLL